MATAPMSPSSTRPVPYMISRAESFWWAYLRISGVALVFLVLGHFMIQHIINDVHDLTLAWVIQDRWSHVGWRVYDALMLAIGYTHGLRGVWQVAQDYVHHRTVLSIAKWALIVVGVVLLLAGAIAVIAAP